MKPARHINNTISQPTYLGKAILCVSNTAVDQQELGFT